ncbi:MAG: PEP/pyruvate-binding domain-containing protein [Chloroflexota bacterium]
MVCMLTYDDAWRAGVQQAGGKGWNLSRLQRFGFRVPHGGILAADVYREVMAQPEIAELVGALAGVSAESVGAPEMETRLTELREGIRAAQLPSEVRQQIGQFLEQSGLGSALLAVRSSATAEDGARTSFAGIHESVLNVEGLDSVILAVLACYASLWTPRALVYRRRFDLSDHDVACAVVLCAMVQGPEGPPVAAGVAFSCDPVTGRRDVIRLSAVSGLGEALVSGAINPEDWTLRYEQSQMFVESRLGLAVLSAQQAEQLAVLIERIHWALGNGQEPQDVEWAFDGRIWWILQARPVTRVPRLAPPGARHLPVIWSNVNLKDVLPGVPTVMSWEGTQSIVRMILLVNLEASGYEVPKGMETLRRIDGRAYFDLTVIQWAYYDALGLLPRDINSGFGGGQPEIPVPAGKPMQGRQGRRRGVAMLRLMGALWQNARTLPAEMARVRAFTRHQTFVSVDSLSGQELISTLQRISRVSVPFARHFQLANGSTLWYGVLESALERFRPGQSRTIASALMADGGGVVSANQGYRITDLAQAAQHDAPARRWIESEDRDPEGWLSLDLTSPFRRELEHFLHEFGHRGVYELELANPRWNEDPTYIVDQVRYLLATGIPAAPRLTAQERRRAGEAQVDSLPRVARPLVRWFAECARQASAHREESKSVLVSILEPMRRIALEGGRRMTTAGLLDTPDDVFHLTWLDLGMYLQGDWDGKGARELVQQRQEQRAAWLSAEPPDTLILDLQGNPTTMPGSPQTAPPAHGVTDARSGGGRRVSGVSAASGKARGPARVIRHPNEGQRLQRGDVLVAPSTDPGWTPLFLRASAIVMEVGGYVSHGAIVAREYGIPAVVNLPGILATVRDGQTLEVDGDEGIVTLAD